jgi:hypothetical protein
MSLVGDIILELRSRIPDAPVVMNAPVLVSLSSGNVPTGEFPPGSTQSIAATFTTLWGETQNAGIQTITLGPTDNVIIANIQANGPPGSGINIYQAGQGTPLTGTADMWSFPLAPGGGGDYIVGLGPFVHTALPTRDTAFLPDTDGNFLGAYTAYRLLNRAISEMVKIAGGIIDVTGVQTQVNQSMYRIDTPSGQGSFYGFTNAWFDGYPMDVVQRSMMYLRNSAAGFSGILSYEQDGPTQVIQVWPQSNRTGGSDFLYQNIDDEQNFFILENGSGFLSIGLAQIDDEIVVYSSVQKIAVPGGTVWQFNGVTRGMGGTTPAAHQSNAIVTELNLRMSGYRMPPTYVVGNSALTLAVPQAWETPLVLHMLSQVRSMEQDDATAQKLLSDFQAQAEKIAKGSRAGRIKPRQIAIWGQNTSDARNVNGIGFGWLVN